MAADVQSRTKMFYPNPEFPMRAFVFLLSFSSATAFAFDTYTIEDLGTLSATPTDGVRAASINNRGHVHGENDRTGPLEDGIQWRSFLWDGFEQRHIYPLNSGSTWSGGLNDRDQCVGKFTARGGGMHGYLWEEEPLLEFDIGDRNFAHLMDINAAGICTGTYLSEEVWGLLYRYHAFVMNAAGAWIDLGTLGGHEAFGKAVNDRNHAVGYTRDEAEHHLGYLWTPAGGMVDVGSLGGFYCDPEDIDNFDRIVGAATNEAGDYRPFVWEAGLMRDLGTLGGSSGRARGINDFGLIVGSAKDSAEIRHAVIWDGQTIADLNDLIAPGSGWDLTGAAEINELGEIAGTGLLDGNQRAYKLTPILSAPRISGCQPGIAGRQNVLFGLGFTPEAEVELYCGLAAGNTELECGEALGIHNARRCATTFADTTGRIEFPFLLPEFAANRDVLLQTAEPVGCIVGELLEQHLQ